MIAALELDRRLTRAGHAVAYLAATLPVTVLAIPAVLLLIVGAALSVVGIGMPVLVAAAAACRRLMRLDRHAANRWLDAGCRHPRPRARAGQRVPPVARPALRPRPVADGDAPGAAAGAGPRARRRGLAPVFALALVLQLGIAGIAGLDEVDYVGPWALGPRSASCCARSRCRRRADDRDPGGALPRALRHHPRRARAPHHRRRAGARAARREPRRPHGVGRVLAARPRALRRRARPAGGAARAGLRPGLDRRRARRPAGRGDHPRRVAGHEPRARRGGRGGVVAGDRQRAPEGRPAGALEELRVSRLRIMEASDPRAGGSSATCTTARSSSSWRSR